MSSAKKVVFNTLVIYLKTVITIVISLFSTRLLLNSLGVADFGLFNVIGGLISMLAFLNAAMTVSTQRYISHNLGKKDVNITRKIFANSVVMHFIIALLLVLFIEIIGLYFLNFKLKIDPNRLSVANMVFHFVVASTFVTIISVPYDAIINAHENMTFLAITGILESVLKLFIAMYLFLSLEDKLLVYGSLIMLTSFLIRIIKQIYVRKKYSETHGPYLKFYDKTIINDLSSFAGWNLFGSFSYIARNQGMSLLLNLFFTTTINAAFGIANQVSSQMNFFSSAMMQALNPQIMKSEGANDRKRMLYLSLIACKLGFLLLAFIAIPCIAEMNSILHFWLKIVPVHTISFCSFILLAAMFNQLTAGLDSAIQATGNIKNYMLVGGIAKVAIIPAAYLSLKLGYSLTVVMMLYSMFEIIGGTIRVYILQSVTELSVKDYFNNVVLKVLPVTLLIILLNVSFRSFWVYEFRWLFSIPISCLAFILLAYHLSLEFREKEIVKTSFLNFIGKFGKLKKI